MKIRLCGHTAIPIKLVQVLMNTGCGSAIKSERRSALKSNVLLINRYRPMISRRSVLRGLYGLGAAALCTGCAGLPRSNRQRRPRNLNIDRVSRSDQDFFEFLQAPGLSIAEIRSRLPQSEVDSVFLIDPAITNEELGEYLTTDASEYPFEIFLRVIVSLINQQVYRYLVRGGKRNVKMGHGFVSHSKLYDAIYLHTHPKGKRIIPNSIGDYMHADFSQDVQTLLVGDGIHIEFKTVAPHSPASDSVDVLIADGTETSFKRPYVGWVHSKAQADRRILDQEAPAFRLDHAFREKVGAGHKLITVKSADGMLVLYDRDRTLSSRLNEVYVEAQLPLPI
jgi:hypothetical protein